MLPIRSIACGLLALLSLTRASEARAQCTANAGNNFTACQGATVNLNGSATGSGPFTYSWSPATGLSSTTVANPVLTVPATNTTYTLTITDSNNCQATAQVTVTVNPTASAILTSSNASYTVFNGVPTFFKCMSNATSNYSFDFGGTAMPGSTHTINWGDGSPVFTATGTTWPTQGHVYSQGIYTVTYTITQPNGCNASQTYSVFLGTNPAGALVNPGSTTGCGPLQLTFPIVGWASNTPGTIYTITFNDGTPPIVYDHPPPASITHLFTTGSCGTTSSDGVNTYQNSFSANMLVENPCGTSGSTVLPIVVSIPGMAGFTISPSNPACLNSTVTFGSTSTGSMVMGNVCANNPALLWSISPATGWTTGGQLGNHNGYIGPDYDPTSWTVGSTNLGVNFNTPGTYTITLIAANMCGSDTISQTVCIEPPPVPAFVVDPIVGCAPMTVVPVNNSSSPNSCNTTFQWNVTTTGNSCGATPQWSFGGGTNANSLQPQFNLTQPGSYTLQLQMQNSCGTFSTSQVVTVNAPPQVNTSSLPGICAGQCVNPSATVQACGTPITSYAWTFPGGTPASANTLVPGQVCFSNPGDPTVSLTVTNACGSATSNSNIAIGTLPPQPVVSSNSPVCAGQTISLSVATVPGVTYNWTGPNGFTSNQPSVTIPNATTANAGVYTVTPVSSGCAGPPASVTVTVIPAPVLVISPPSAAVCIGGSVTLNVSGAGNYQWFQGGNLLGTGPTLTFSPGATMTVTVTGDQGGCPGSATAAITVNPLPVVNAGPAQTFCDQPIPVQLNGSPAPGTWSGQNVTAGGVFTPVPGEWGSFTLTYTHTNANGCTNSATTTVTVQELTLIAQTQPDTAVCVGSGPLTLQATPPGGVWTGASPGGVFMPNAVGFHTVTYNYGTGTCLTTDQMTVEVLAAPNLTLPPAFALCADAAPVDLPATPAGGTWSGNGVTGAPFQFDPGAVAPGNHTLTYSYSDGSGCAANGQVVATVNPLPVVNAGVDLTLCDQPVPFVLGGSPVGGTWSATWMDVTPGGTLTPGGVGTDMLTYTFTTAAGCMASDNITVDVVPIDEPALAGDDEAFCVGSGNVQLTGLPSGGTWSGPQVTPGGSFNTSVPGLYTLTYSVGGGTCLTQDQVTLTVHALPIVDAGNDIGVCLDGGPQTLTASPAGGTWSGVGVDPVTGVFDPLQALPGGNPVTYTWTDPITGCVNSDNALVTVHALPVADFSHGPVACVGASFSFTNNSTGANAAQWTFGDGGTSNALDPAHTYTATGTYTVTLTAGTGAGCTDVSTSTVTVWAVPQAEAILSPTTGCGPLEVGFTNNSSGEGMQFNWNLGGLGQSTDPAPPPFTFPADPLQVATYNVTLTASNVCGSQQDTHPITVLPTPTAVFAPDLNIYCAYADVPFGNASYGLPDGFIWDFGDGNTSTAATPIVTHGYPVEGDAEEFTITLVAYNACGSDTAQYTITILPNEVTAFFNTDPFQGCAPLNVTLTSFNTGDTAMVWDLGDGNTSLASSLDHTYNQPGSYTITLSAYGCGFDQYTQTITVLPSPAPSFTSMPAAVCVGEPFTFTNTTPGVTGVLWNFGDGTTSTLSTVQHTYASSGNWPVTLTVTAANNGCTASITQNVSVLVTPVAAFTPVPGDGCVPHQVAFQNGSQNATFFTWDFGDGNTSAQAAPFHTYTAPGTYTVTLTAALANGCQDTHTAQVVVHPLPVSAFTLSGTESCTSPFTVQANNASMGAVGFNWDLGNGETSLLNNPQVTYTAPGVYNITLTSVNQFGCVHSSSQTVTVYATPLAGFTVLPQPACAGYPVIFSNTSQNASGFQWWLGDGSGSQAASPMHVYDAPGLYDVTLVATGGGGCTDTLTIPGAVLVHPTPVADFSTDTVASPRNAVRFNNLSQGATTNQWDFGDGLGSTDTHPVHLFDADGGGWTVCLAVANTFGCTDTICQWVPVNADPGIWVPNAFTPNADGANDDFLPILNGYDLWNYRLLIFDRWGEVIFDTTDRTKGWDGRARGRDVQIGVYVWKVVLERDGDARDHIGHVTVVR
ncbi:MAG: PKD domain-containing protein [Flavobacteriales bacterium]|nr:PKD domain-containing protein [Flavobacteriales bacterium]